MLSLPVGIVASSGDYERYFEVNGRRYHHPGPEDGLPRPKDPQGDLVSASLDRIDGLGAAIMVMGSQAGRHLITPPGLDGLIVDDQRGVWMSPAWVIAGDTRMHPPR